MKNIAIYPGTFDPITKGHEDIVKRAARLFDKVIVAIAGNPKKSPAFSLQARIDIANHVLDGIKNVEVAGFNNLLINFAREKQANIIIRGLRAISDFDFEFQMAGMNRMLDHKIETIFLSPAEQYTFISSTMVKEVASLGGNVEAFVAPIVVQALSKLTKYI